MRLFVIVLSFVGFFVILSLVHRGRNRAFDLRKTRIKTILVFCYVTIELDTKDLRIHFGSFFVCLRACFFSFIHRYCVTVVALGSIEMVVWNTTHADTHTATRITWSYEMHHILIDRQNDKAPSHDAYTKTATTNRWIHLFSNVRRFICMSWNGIISCSAHPLELEICGAFHSCSSDLHLHFHLNHLPVVSFQCSSINRWQWKSDQLWGFTMTAVYSWPINGGVSMDFFRFLWPFFFVVRAYVFSLPFLRFLFTQISKLILHFIFLYFWFPSEKDAFSSPINLTIILQSEKKTVGENRNRWLLKLEIDIYLIDSAKLFANPLFPHLKDFFLSLCVWMCARVIYVAHESSFLCLIERKEEKAPASFQQHVCIWEFDAERQQHAHWHPDMKRVFFFVQPAVVSWNTAKERKSHRMFTLYPHSWGLGWWYRNGCAHKSNHHFTFVNPFPIDQKQYMRTNEKAWTNNGQKNTSLTKHFNGHFSSKHRHKTTSNANFFYEIKFIGDYDQIKQSFVSSLNSWRYHHSIY